MSNGIFLNNHLEAPYTNSFCREAPQVNFPYCWSLFFFPIFPYLCMRLKLKLFFSPFLWFSSFDNNLDYFFSPLSHSFTNLLTHFLSCVDSHVYNPIEELPHYLINKMITDDLVTYHLKLCAMLKTRTILGHEVFYKVLGDNKFYSWKHV